MKIKREKSTSTKGHYVTNAVLLPAVLEAKRQGKVTEELIKMIWMIAERYSRKHNFVGYSYREDMVSSAVVNFVHNNNALKFNPEKQAVPNPFAYYTTGIHNAFLQYMANEKNNRNVKDALLVAAGANPSFNYGQNEKDESGPTISDDLHIGAANHLEDASKNPPPAPIQDRTKTIEDIHPSDETHHTRTSFGSQSFSSLDPGKPGKKKLSMFPDLNPGPVKIYKKDDYYLDENGKLVIKEKPPEPAKPVKAAKKKKKAVKKPPLKKKKKVARKGK